LAFARVAPSSRSGSSAPRRLKTRAKAEEPVRCIGTMDRQSLASLIVLQHLMLGLSRRPRTGRSASVLGRPCRAARAAPISTDPRCLDYRRGSMMHTPGLLKLQGSETSAATARAMAAVWALVGPANGA